MKHLQNQKFAFTAASAANKTLHLLEENERFTRPKVGSESFSDTKMENKLTSDATFLFSLGKDLNESESMKFNSSLEILLEATYDLFKEVNLKPRTCSNAIDTKEISESTILGIYKKNLIDSINNEFSELLFEGTLLQTYKKETILLTESIISSNVQDEADSEIFFKYAIFENVLVSNIVKLVIPSAIEENINLFINQQDSEYFEIFDKNAASLKNTIEESCIILSSLIAPKLFEESAGISDSGCNKFAGISKVIR